MIYISVGVGHDGGAELCRENVKEGESIYAAFQRMFAEGYIPNEGDIISIIDTEEE